MIPPIPAGELRALFQLIGRNIAGELPLPFDPAARIQTRSATPDSDVAAPDRQNAVVAGRGTWHDAPSPDASVAAAPARSATLTLIGLRAPLAASADIPLPERASASGDRLPAEPSALATPAASATLATPDDLSLAWSGATSAPREGTPSAMASLNRASGVTNLASAPWIAAATPQTCRLTEAAVVRSGGASSADRAAPDAAWPGASASAGGPAPSDTAATEARGPRRAVETRPVSAQLRSAETIRGEEGAAAAIAKDASPDVNGSDEMRWLRTTVGAIATAGPAMETAGDAGGRAEQQTERAGVIASFILNAAMLPGWPPPRPFEPVAYAQQVAVLKHILSELSPEESDLGERLLRLLRNPALLERLLRRLMPAPRRARLLAALTLVMTRLATLMELVEQMVAEEDDVASHGGGRTRLQLR